MHRDPDLRVHRPAPGHQHCSQLLGNAGPDGSHLRRQLVAEAVLHGPRSGVDAHADQLSQAAVVYSRGGIAALAGLAEAQRQQPEACLVPFRELDLVMLAAMLDAHWPTGLQHDAADGTGSDDLLHERQAILLHVLGGWAQGIGIEVAERVADDQVGMSAAQCAVVRQHDPGLDLETFRGELTACVAERVAVKIPSRERGDETMAAPRLVPDRHIAPACSASKVRRSGCRGVAARVAW